jgi:uncharacterized Zn finger protein (UPF0148 family)
MTSSPHPVHVGTGQEYRVIYNSLFDLWNDDIIAEAKIKAGVCPDCGNDKCMADGVTGLWCPNCDASYLLNTEANNEHENQNQKPDVEQGASIQRNAKNGMGTRHG